MFIIACRDFGIDCNAVMKGRNIDESIDAAIKHGIAMHKQDARKLQTADMRAEIASKAKEYVK